eukprot:scpid108650/ scgid11225/ 
MAGQCDTCAWLAPVMSRAPVTLLQVTVCSNLEALQVFPGWLLVQNCLWQSIPHWHDAVWGKSAGGNQELVARDSAQAGGDGAVLGLLFSNDVPAEGNDVTVALCSVHCVRKLTSSRGG